MEHRRMIDPLCPSGELTGIVTNGKFKGIEWTVGYFSQSEKVQVIEPMKYLSHTRSMESWQGPDRERRHKDFLRSVPDIVEFRWLYQRYRCLCHEFVTAHSRHTIEVI